MIGIESQCYSCAHFGAGAEGVSGAGSGSEDEAPPVCSAFPSGIPDGVLGNESDHRRPYPGDRGVRWTTDGHPFPERSFETLRRLV